MKRILCFLLAVILLAGVCTVPASAASAGFDFIITGTGWLPSELDQALGYLLYVPTIKFEVKNTSGSEISSISVKAIFTNETEKEDWGDGSAYPVSSWTDPPLKPGYKKSGSVAAGRGYNGKIYESSLPKITAEVYVNGDLYGKVTIDRTYSPKTTSTKLAPKPDPTPKPTPAPTMNPEIQKYNEAKDAFQSGDLKTALMLFESLGNYEDSRDMLCRIHLRMGQDYEAAGEIVSALSEYDQAGSYGADSADKLKYEVYSEACALEQEDIPSAIEKFTLIFDYADAESRCSALMAEAAALAKEADAAEDYSTALKYYVCTEQTETIKQREYELAQLCYSSGAYEQAVKAYEILGEYSLSVSKLPMTRYAYGKQQMESGNYQAAAEQFAALDGAKDSAELLKECNYRYAAELMSSGNPKEAGSLFESLGDYGDSRSMITECDYLAAEQTFKAGRYEEAETLYTLLGDYKDSAQCVLSCRFMQAETKLEAGDYSEAREIFDSLGDYSGSADRVRECDYRLADDLVRSGRYREAANMFKYLGSYKDSPQRLDECRVLIGDSRLEAGNIRGALQEYLSVTEKDDSVKENIYRAGEKVAATGDIAAAIDVLSSVADYAPAEALLREMADLLDWNEDYALMFAAFTALGDVSRAEECAAKTTADAILSLPLSTLPGTGTLEQEIRYAYAVYSGQVGNLQDAVDLFSSVPGYKDADEQLKSDGLKDLKPKKSVPTIGASAEQSLITKKENGESAFSGNVKTGDILLFGHYEQDNDKKNGAEPIEWKVLDKKGDKVLLLSVSALDCKAFHSKSEITNWAASSLRSWLNKGFFEDAFSAEERELIEKSTVPADANSDYKSDQGRQTIDNVFLLSGKEAGKYLKSAADRTCQPTKFAKAAGAKNQAKSGECWLRTMGAHRTYAEVISKDGVNTAGNAVNACSYVQPAVWVNLSEVPAVAANPSGTKDLYEPEDVKYLGDELKEGDILRFGSYEQDNDLSNGKEEIEWLVLSVDEKNGKALLVSKYAMDSKPFNEDRAGVTWETSDIRAWLNADFLKEAFHPYEQAAILQSSVSADKNPKYSTNSGNATTDRIFLLSIAETEKYFKDDASRRCAPTAYAEAQGANTGSSKTAEGETSCWWWLRSPGVTQGLTARVNCGGSVYYRGDDVNDDNDCVRPALWISLNP